LRQLPCYWIPVDVWGVAGEEEKSWKGEGGATGGEGPRGAKRGQEGPRGAKRI